MTTLDHNVTISGLYAIADSSWNPCGSLALLTKKFLDGGCQIVQLRMKERKQEDILTEAKAIAAFKGKYNFQFIINDHADIATEVGADGVHVGEHDTSVCELRRRYGNRLIIGYSSHFIDEAKKAEGDGADYVAFGAIFPTKTKRLGYPVQGAMKLAQLIQTMHIPVVAIGGIGRDNVAQVIKAGASAVAAITALSQADDIEAEVRWFVKKMLEKQI